MSRFLLAIGIGAVFLFAFMTAIRPAFVLAYGLLALYVLAWAWPKLVARTVRVERHLDAGSPTVGEPFEETFRVSKSSRLPAPWVEVVDAGNLPDYRPGRVLAVGRSAVSWRARGTYRRRGWVTFGPTEVVVREPFGLFRAGARIPERHQVLVYPRVRDIPDLTMPASHHSGLTQRHGQWAEYPPETGGVREYQPGDSFGRIHWPLSQRHQQLMSRTFEQPMTADLWVVLDLDSSVHRGAGEESTLEYAVSLAASISMHVVRRGRRVGLMANDARGTLLEPHRAARQDQMILDYLATADAGGTRHLAEALAWDRLRRLPRRAVAVITPSPDPGWLMAAQALRERGSSLLLFYLDGSSFGEGGGSHLTFDLGTFVDLYVVRQGDDFTRLTRTRDAVRLL
jgi:uncharacterized protein (DUF58 family)